MNEAQWFERGTVVTLMCCSLVTYLFFLAPLDFFGGRSTKLFGVCIGVSWERARLFLACVGEP